MASYQDSIEETQRQQCVTGMLRFDKFLKLHQVEERLRRLEERFWNIDECQGLLQKPTTVTEEQLQDFMDKVLSRLEALEHKMAESEKENKQQVQHPDRYAELESRVCKVEMKPSGIEQITEVPQFTPLKRPLPLESVNVDSGFQSGEVPARRKRRTEDDTMKDIPLQFS